jgi:hypothetical protein
VLYRNVMKLGLFTAFFVATQIIGVAQDSPSSPAWREYVYPENSFAITLPTDPHPHKSAQVPNGTAYSVRLSSASFILVTTEANERCVEAVRSQSAMWEKWKNGPLEGFRGISFREVEGPGYTGVEFVQQVPSGSIDYERWVCGAHHMYVFASQWGSSKSKPNDLRRIVDSFRILTK